MGSGLLGSTEIGDGVAVCESTGVSLPAHDIDRKARSGIKERGASRQCNGVVMEKVGRVLSGAEAIWVQSSQSSGQ